MKEAGRRESHTDKPRYLPRLKQTETEETHLSAPNYDEGEDKEDLRRKKCTFGRGQGQDERRLYQRDKERDRKHVDRAQIWVLGFNTVDRLPHVITLPFTWQTSQGDYDIPCPSWIHIYLEILHTAH